MLFLPFQDQYSYWFKWFITPWPFSTVSICCLTFYSMCMWQSLWVIQHPRKPQVFMCTRCCDLLMCCSSTDLQARWNLSQLQEWDGGHEGSSSPTPCLLYAAGCHRASSSQPRYGRYNPVLHPNVESCSMRVPDNDPIKRDYCVKDECVICEVGVTYELKITSSAWGTDMLTRWRGKAVFGGWA